MYSERYSWASASIFFLMRENEFGYGLGYGYICILSRA